ncbi:MAG: nitrogen regulation protein NR(I) [Gammaproteobacteria bacterium]|nr:nitrogen regulation protein NR(I) [Gammaproteobacteria bacterium]
MPTTDEIWIVDDDQSIRWVLDKALQKEGLQARLFESAEDTLDALKDFRPRVIVTDIRMPGMSGIELLAILKQQYPQIPIVIMTAYSDLDSAVSAYEGGAFEYLPKPFDTDEAIDIIQRASQSVTTDESAESPATELASMPDIIGESPAMQEVFRAIGRLMRSDVTVLVTGESGTGKELVAQALHRHSMRKDSPFIALNMAAIPKDLMESELFGHEKGAFTGANTQRKGRFEQADGGTLFMDEIGDMPAELQTRLLRVLADGGFYRIGGHTPVKVNVRIIAATHQDLLQRVETRQFREDLYHRLNVIRIRIPALRERLEDIPLLASRFLTRIAQELEVEPKILTEEAEKHLMKMPWPGNVRELENTCRWLTVMCHSREVYIRDLPVELQESRDQPASSAETNTIDWRSALNRWLENAYQSGDLEAIKHVIEDAEQTLIRSALTYTEGKKHEAANLLGWGRNTLTRKIQGYNIE